MAAGDGEGDLTFFDPEVVVDATRNVINPKPSAGARVFDGWSPLQRKRGRRPSMLGTRSSSPVDSSAGGRAAVSRWNDRPHSS
jgi:hypothetical protein